MRARQVPGLSQCDFIGTFRALYGPHGIYTW